MRHFPSIRSKIIENQCFYFSVFFSFFFFAFRSTSKILTFRVKVRTGIYENTPERDSLTFNSAGVSIRAFFFGAKFRNSEGFRCRVGREMKEVRGEGHYGAKNGPARS